MSSEQRKRHLKFWLSVMVLALSIGLPSYAIAIYLEISTSPLYLTTKVAVAAIFLLWVRKRWIRLTNTPHKDPTPPTDALALIIEPRNLRKQKANTTV